jgi:hypothetical protein
MSKISQNFAEYTLGPNYLQVLKFWEYIERLTEDEMDKINDSYLVLGADLCKSIRDSATSAAKSVVSDEIETAAYMAACSGTSRYVFVIATLELIGNSPSKLCYSLIMNHKKD